MFRSAQFIVFALLITLISPVKAFAADANVGNEVVDAANTSLTRTGSGTAAIPYKLHLNVGNANTWTALQSFNSGLTSAGTITATGGINLGDGGDAASLSGTTVTINTGDNTANAFLVQQGTIKYLQVNTTNAAEDVVFGNTTTNPNFSFLGNGSTNFNGGVTAANGLAVANGFNSTGFSNLTPSGTNDVTVTTDADSKLVVTGLATSAGNALCLDGSDEVVLCSAGGTNTLQDAYNGGNTITTTDARDIGFAMSDTATDSNFNVNLNADNTVAIYRSNNASSEAPSQLLSLQNQDNDLNVGGGLVVESASGGLTTALDVSDADIVTALSTGSNDIVGTNWSIQGATGNVQTSGDVAVGGGDVTTTTSTASLFNTSATTVNIAGAATTYTIGSTTATANIRGGTVSLPNATTLNAFSALASVDSLSVGGGYGSTGTTISNSGNIQTNGNFTVDGVGTITGNTTVGGDVAVNGGDVTTSATTGSLFNTNATTLNIGGAATTVSLGSSVGTTTVSNDLNITGLATFNGGATIPAAQTLTANGTATFSPNGTNDVTVNTDADSYLVLTGLTTATGDSLCIDASDNVIKCSGALNATAAGSADYEQMTAALAEQQKEIDQLKKDIAELKSLINR